MEALQWEFVPTTEQYQRLERAAIFGGWLVKNTSNLQNIPLFPQESGVFHSIKMPEDYTQRITLTFVPDSNHIWSLTEIYDQRQKST